MMEGVPVGRSGARRVQEAFRSVGLSLKKDAMGALLKLEGGMDAVEEVLNAVQQKQMLSTIVTVEDIESALAERQHFQNDDVGAELDVINAMDCPRFKWEPVRRHFYANDTPTSVLGTARSKVDMYQDRYHLMIQRIKRNKLFTRPALEMNDSRGHCELTPIQSLIGSTGQRKYIIGGLNQLEDGRYFLEDISAQIRLDLTNTQTATGMFTEGCIVIAEGIPRSDGVFEVLALGFPPSEPKEQSLHASPGIDFFGGGALNVEDIQAKQRAEVVSKVGLVIVLSEVHLDEPATLARLRTLFQGYESTSSIPSMYVLMGNFCSKGSTVETPNRVPLIEMRRALASLASLINEFPATRDQSHFVIMPGPGDVGLSQALPRPPLVEYFAEELRETVAHLTMASSPCRVRFHSQFLVFHRDDLLQKMRQSMVLPCAGDDAGHFQKMTATVLQQSHLSPIPITRQPIYWEGDNSLYLYPLPELLVIGDTFSQQECAFEGVKSINPGSFSFDGSFLAYRPQTRETELSGL